MTVVLLLKANHHQRPLPLPAPAAIGPTVPTNPAPAVPPVTATTPTVPVEPPVAPAVEAPLVAAPKVRPRPVRPAACKPEAPTESCIHGKLPPGMNLIIANSLHSAGIRLCPGESLQIRRFGTQVLFENAPARIPSSQQSLFGDTLRGSVGTASLPEAFTIECASGKGLPK
jgi:hypothetical protein